MSINVLHPWSSTLWVHMTHVSFLETYSFWKLALCLCHVFQRCKKYHVSGEMTIRTPTFSRERLHTAEFEVCIFQFQALQVNKIWLYLHLLVYKPDLGHHKNTILSAKWLFHYLNLALPNFTKLQIWNFNLVFFNSYFFPHYEN